MKKRGRYRCKEKCTIHFSAGGKKYYKPKKKPVYHKERQAKYMRKMSRRKQYIPKMIHYLIFLSEGIDINNWTSKCKECGNEMDVSISKVRLKLRKKYCSKECYAKGERERLNKNVLKSQHKKIFINRFINRLAYLNGTSTNKHQYASVAKKIKQNMFFLGFVAPFIVVKFLVVALPFVQSLVKMHTMLLEDVV